MAAICEWATEMVQIEKGSGGRSKVPWAAQQVYALTEEEGSNGAAYKTIASKVALDTN